MSLNYSLLRSKFGRCIIRYDARSWIHDAQSFTDTQEETRDAGFLCDQHQEPSFKVKTAGMKFLAIIPFQSPETLQILWRLSYVLGQVESLAIYALSTAAQGECKLPSGQDSYALFALHFDCICDSGDTKADIHGMGIYWSGKNRLAVVICSIEELAEWIGE
jgi:hypothetical protein